VRKTVALSRLRILWLSLPAIFVLLLLQYAVGQNPPFAFVVIGDSGCGCDEQEQVAKRMIEWHDEKPFSIVLMTGDNIYARDKKTRGGSRALFTDRFDRYYKPLTDQGVKFYAVLGNHDMETNKGLDEIVDKERFHILGRQGFYWFSPLITNNGNPLIVFFGLNSVRLTDGEDTDQVAWLGKELADQKALWRIVFFHHPIYTPPGKHEEEAKFRIGIEKILVAAGVQATFAGHNHFYARMKPRDGVVHFISGGGGRVLKTPEKDEFTAEALSAHHFMYLEVTEEKMDFWAVPTAGPPFDHGTLLRQPVDAAKQN
jgi:hypothetical protein